MTDVVFKRGDIVVHKIARHIGLFVQSHRVEPVGGGAVPVQPPGVFVCWFDKDNNYQQRRFPADELELVERDK